MWVIFEWFNFQKIQKSSDCILEPDNNMGYWSLNEISKIFGYMITSKLQKIPLCSYELEVANCRQMK